MLGVAAALVAGALVAGACGATPEEAPLEENVDSYSAAATCETCEPPDDPPPTCTPSCAGKTCGASNGCGGKCGSGSCPAGTTCGGGGVYAQCGCTPQCSGKSCGAADGCGGICTGGSCPYGQACGAAGVPGQCATLPTGQGVECFVFNDGYTNMAGPSQAIYLASGSGQACIPDGTSSGTCRKWFGRCQTTDPSHTPVYFNVFNDGETDMAGPSDAVFSPGGKQACVPGNGAAGICRRWFGEATLPDGRSVECKLFDDGGARKTKFTEHAIYNHGYGSVCFPDGSTHGLCRRWFGECMVAGCGDGACNGDETPSNCPSDCKCGDQLCNGNEWCGSCSQDCGGCCGNGVCNPSVGESCSTCPQDCGGGCCGNGACDNNETCSSCPQDCGSCPVPTCSGQPAGSQAQYFSVGIEDYWGCLLQSRVFLANSQSEAVQCGQAAFPGYNIATGTVGTYVYNTGNVNGCADVTFAALSSSKAASCATANGYPYAGACP